MSSTAIIAAADDDDEDNDYRKAQYADRQKKWLYAF